MKCEYGCEDEAIHQFKNGKWCCSINSSSCKGMKKKNGECKIGKPSGRKGKFGAQSWNKGKNSKTDERIKKGIESLLKSYSDGSIIPSFKEKNHTESSRTKISQSMMGNRNAILRGDRQLFYNGIRMDSSWEVAVAKYFDENGLVWKYSEMRYLLSTGNYFHPDFFIYDADGSLEKIIEVKGYFREENKKKFELFLSEYSDLIVELWNKEILKKLKIL